MHKKDRVPSQVKRFLCNSPVFDQDVEDCPIAKNHAIFSTGRIDKTFREFKDEGIYPVEKGTYHIYHRIDGKLAAVGVIDILSRYLNSAYFIYDPEFSFLNMGVVGAIRELEFMRMAKKKNFNTKMQFY